MRTITLATIALVVESCFGIARHHYPELAGSGFQFLFTGIASLTVGVLCGSRFTFEFARGAASTFRFAWPAFAFCLLLMCVSPMLLLGRVSGMVPDPIALRVVQASLLGANLLFLALLIALARADLPVEGGGIGLKTLATLTAVAIARLSFSIPAGPIGSPLDTLLEPLRIVVLHLGPLVAILQGNLASAVRTATLARKSAAA